MNDLILRDILIEKYITNRIQICHLHSPHDIPLSFWENHVKKYIGLKTSEQKMFFILKVIIIPFFTRTIENKNNYRIEVFDKIRRSKNNPGLNFYFKLRLFGGGSFDYDTLITVSFPHSGIDKLDYDINSSCFVNEVLLFRNYCLDQIFKTKETVTIDVKEKVA